MNPQTNLPAPRRKRFWSACIAVGTAIAAAASLAHAQSATVVISQVYGGGGNTGAPFTHDFVELHNISTATVDITGWSIQYASSTGSSWTNKLDLAASIPAGGYFLIRLAGGSNGVALPTPDATGNINMGGAAGKVALVNSTTVLTGSDPSADASVVDFVGFGTNANGFEGSGPAPAPSNSTSVARLDNGSQDTNNNAADFVVLNPPEPRNSSSPAYLPGGAPIPLAIGALAPAHNAGLVSPGTPLVIALNNPVTSASGSVTLSRGETTVQTFTLPDDAVISGNTITLQPDAPLAGGIHTVVISPDAFGDGDSTAPAVSPDWSFSVVSAALLATTPYTQNFAGFNVDNPALPDGWSLSGSVTAVIFAEDLPGNHGWGAGFRGGLRGGIEPEPLEDYVAPADVDVLGYQPTSNASSIVKTLTMVNNTGDPITDLTVRYTGRTERPDEARKPFYTVSVAGGPNVVPLGYSVTDGDGQARSAVVSGLSIAPGAVFTITWSAGRGAGSSGASSQIGISDVFVAAGALPVQPVVAASAPDYATLTQTSLTVNSSLTSDGGSEVTAQGFIIAPAETNPSPKVGDADVVAFTVPSPGTVDAYSVDLSGLDHTTAYALRAFATSGAGTGYSQPISFQTLAPVPGIGSGYFEDFEGLAASMTIGGLPAGWTILSSGGVNGYAGAWDATNAGGVVGGAFAPGVLGYQHSGSTGIATATLSLVNDTGAAITRLNVSYLGRVARVAQLRHPEWTVRVDGVEIPGLAYSTAAGEDETKTRRVTGLEIAPGATFTITWSSDTEVGTSGSRRHIGISNVAVNVAPDTGGDYASWASDNGIEGELPGADFDFDGLSNFMEYALGLDPKAADGSPGTFANGSISFAKGADAVENGDVVYAIETSATLAPDSWTVVTPTTNTATEISYLLPAGQGRLFARLVVSAAP